MPLSIEHRDFGLAHASAGEDTLSRQPDPGVSLRQVARTDLAAEYAALGQAQLAQRYCTEFSANHTTP